MCRLICAMSLKVIILGTILGTVVSKFDDSTKIIDEFKRDLIDNKKCVDTEQWSLVDNNIQGFNIIYRRLVSIKPGTLELYVNVTTARKEKFLITLSSDNTEASVSYIYEGSGQESEIGWCKLLFPVDYSGLSHINLLGYSDDSENLLMNYYEPIIYKINDDQAVLLYILEHKMNKADWIETKENKNTGNEIMETVKHEYKESDNKYIRNGMEMNIDRQEDGGRLVGTWVLVLIVVAAVTLICLVAIGAYHLGLSKGIAKNPTYIEDIEPARVVTIPRVKGVTDSPIGEFM